MGCVTLKGCSEALTEPFLEAFIIPGHKINNILIGLKFTVSINSQISSKGVGTVRAYDVKNIRKRAYRKKSAT